MTKSLPVKYRPNSFDDLTEQTAIKLILTEQIKTSTFKHGYLFCGGAGTGKTTSARIFANMINKGKGTPIEVNAADNNGVDDVRSIIEGAKFKALDSEYKIYILDEVHMFSVGAWNAMLKLLEEPPSYAVFIMCTTDPQKIPATILSRVQRYDFQRISFDGIVKRLIYILEQENKSDIDYDNTCFTKNKYQVSTEAIEYIAKVADGGMRDAIKLLDTCLSYNSHLGIKEVVEVLGTANYTEMFDLTEYLVGSEKVDYEAIIVKINDIYNRGVDLKQFIKQYYQFLLDLITFNLTDSYEYIKIPSTYNLVKESQTKVFALRKLLKIIIGVNSEIKWEQNPKPLIEARLLTMEGV